MQVLPEINARLRRILLGAYQPCPEFSRSCGSMRWNPAAGHVPRGFCGATGDLTEVALVLVVAEPGDPHASETHPASPAAALESSYAYAYRCFSSGKDLFHRNIRKILDLCWPGESFESHMRRAWITESVLCSAKREGASVPSSVSTACRVRYLDEQLRLFPTAVVAALGGKAAVRLAGRQFVRGFAAAPPGCNFRGALQSWEAVARAVQTRAS